MGVVGAGKTTVGTLLAQKLGWQFADADNFHPAANVEKIRRGIPLDDSDRAPWLAALHNAILQWKVEGQNAVLACSSFKRKYRKELVVDGVHFVYLKGDYELINNDCEAGPDTLLPTQYLKASSKIWKRRTMRSPSKSTRSPRRSSLKLLTS